MCMSMCVTDALQTFHEREYGYQEVSIHIYKIQREVMSGVFEKEK